MLMRIAITQGKHAWSLEEANKAWRKEQGKVTQELIQKLVIHQKEEGMQAIIDCQGGNEYHG